MGYIHGRVGRVSIETRRESFVIHPNYGYDETGNEHSDELGAFGIYWREHPHPEFLLADLPHLIVALERIAAGEESERANPSFWLARAAAALDCAVQTSGPPHSEEIDGLEDRCDELAALLKSEGR